MSTETTKELICKIATGNYSDEDLATFLKAVKTMDKAPFMEAYRLLYDEINKYPGEELAPGFKDQLEKRLDLLEAEKDFLSGNLVSIAPQRETILFKRKWWNSAAAAAILIMVAVGTFLWVKDANKNTEIVASNEFKNDVAPGGNKAILTLSNGKKITLDSAAKGSLANQGGIRVTKVDAGRLSYTGNLASGSEMVYNAVSTPSGGQYEVTLADGTKVWLNALSTLKFPTAFSGHERSVQLTGEAYFEVSKDKKKPFHVNANGIDVEVLGTHFNVNAYPDETTVKTTLLEGKVKLVKAGANILLEPGEQGQTDGTSGFVLVKNADVDQAVAWKNGFFSFEDANIQTVMRQLERWYGIKVQYEGKPVQGSFEGKMGRDLNLTQVLTGLSKSEVHFHLEGTTLTVLP